MTNNSSVSCRCQNHGKGSSIIGGQGGTSNGKGLHAITVVHMVKNNQSCTARCDHILQHASKISYDHLIPRVGSMFPSFSTHQPSI